MKIQVPEGMLKAATQGATSFDQRVSYPPYVEAIVEAALCWLSENPIAPNLIQDAEMRRDFVDGCGFPMQGCSQYVATEWQRRMFLA